MIPRLDAQRLSVDYTTSVGLFGRRRFRALHEVSLAVGMAETVGVIGESGCGKSTLGKALVGLIAPAAGSIAWQGADIAHLDRAALRRRRRSVQMIFQDPLASLNPRMTIAEILEDPLRNFGMPRPDQKTIAGMLRRVGLPQDASARRSNGLSGGQCQRVGIARALITNPEVIVCDEPVAALDVSVQAQVVNLLQDIQEREATSLIFISHDLAIVRHMAHRLVVLYAGHVVETGEARRLFDRPAHPYTIALFAAARRLEARPINRPQTSDVAPKKVQVAGCPYRNCCNRAAAICATVKPPLRDIAVGQAVACHLPGD
jgi:oligopeptide/dipeptide ABC transporter ATP-binding protein